MNMRRSHDDCRVLGTHSMPLHSVAKLTGHDEATLKSIYHHVVGEIVTPEIQAAADWMEALQATQQAKDDNAPSDQHSGGTVSSIHLRRAKL